MNDQSKLLIDVETLFNDYDEKANRLKKIFENFWKSGIFSGVIAVIIFAYLTIYRKDFEAQIPGLILPVAEVLLIIFSIIALSKIVPRLKKRFIATRRSAEILRLHQLFIENNIPLKQSTLFQLEEYTIPEDIVALEHNANLSLKEEDSVEYHKNSLAELKKFVLGQQKYHRQERIDKFHNREHRLELALQIILFIFVGIVGLKLIAELLMYSKNNPFYGLNVKLFLYTFKFSVIFLPPLYAALEGFYYFSEWKRNIMFSERVNKEYKVLLDHIEILLKKQSLTQSEVYAIAVKVSNIFHEDNQNWYRWYLSKKIGARI